MLFANKNGVRNATQEEITAMQEAQARFEAEQAKLPPTESERLEALEAAFLEFVEVMMGG